LSAAQTGAATGKAARQRPHIKQRKKMKWTEQPRFNGIMQSDDFWKARY
jgi:hypothetical protein